ncbi:dinuclear metal center YbgI/SA1388 family protein [Nakamurella sp. UYEF19]|uniref:Nif3-like dinuclear metal center hexameric protein n=1 Tax=Nakamurella sp. UYEF19 TaxID=1756392 RepID=UPI003391EBF8
MTVRLGDLIAVLEAAYPPALAESWDTGIGLTCGDPEADVTGVLLAVDLDLAVVAQAEELGAQLVLTHHPLLFRPVQSVAVDTPKGALLHRMIGSGIAHYAAHTNADKAVGGVNDVLAALLGLTQVRPLVPDPPDALPAGHPQAGRTGTGRVGELPEPCTLAELTERVAKLLPPTTSGVRSAGDADRVVRALALCGGAGDSELDSAIAVGADAYLTSDLRHHVVQEHLATPGAPAVVEVAHWAGEWPWLAAAACLLTGAVADGTLAGSVTTTVSALRTDPWTVHRPSGQTPEGF